MIGQALSWIRTKFQALTMDQWDRQIREALNGGRSAAGPWVGTEDALTLGAVYACVRVLTESISTLPLGVYRRDGRKREELTKHPVYRLLHDQPNPEMTAEGLRGAQMLNLLLRGTAYSRALRSGRGQVAELWPENTDGMTPRRPRPGSPLVYDIRDPSTGATETVPESGIWRVTGLTRDGLTGLDPIRYARETFGAALAQKRHGSRMYQHGTRLSGVVEHPGTMKDPEYKRFKESWEETYGGAENTGKTAILESGMKYHPLSMTMENAQWIEGMRFSVSDICRFFGVPLHMVYDHDTQPRANQEQSGLEFVVYSLRPWLVRIEQSARRDLLLPSERDVYIRHNVDGLLRGDFKTRQEGFATGKQWGWLSTNDIRAFDDLDPIEGGDEYWRPVNMVPVGTPVESPGSAPSDTSERQEALLRGAAARVAKREVEALKRASEREDLVSWAREFYARHSVFVAEAMATNSLVACQYTERQLQQIEAAVVGDRVQNLVEAWDHGLAVRVLEEVGHGDPVR